MACGDQEHVVRSTGLDLIVAGDGRYLTPNSTQGN